MPPTLPAKPSYRVRANQGKAFPCFSDISELAMALDAHDFTHARGYLDLLIEHMQANGYVYEAQMLRWRLSHQDDPYEARLSLMAVAPASTPTQEG